MKNKLLAVMLGLSFLLVGIQEASAEVTESLPKSEPSIEETNMDSLNRLKASLNISVENCSTEMRLSCSWLWQQLNEAINIAIATCDLYGYGSSQCATAMDAANNIGEAYILLCGTGPPPEGGGESRNIIPRDIDERTNRLKIGKRSVRLAK